MGKIIAMVIACAGCNETTHSVLPPYVRDLRPAYGGLQMVQCQTIVTTTRSYSVVWGHQTRREVSSGACWQQVVSTEPPPGDRQ